MSVTGNTELAYLIPEIWSSEFYSELRANLPMANFFDHTSLYAADGILNYGDTLHVQTISAPSGEILTDDKQEFSTEALSVSQNDIVINQRASAAFEITDLGKLQSKAFEEQAKEALVYAIAKQIEDKVISTISPSSSSPDHLINPASASDLAAADVASMRSLLSAQKVPNSNRALFLAPSYFGDLLTKTNFVSSDFIPAGSPTAYGQFPTPLYGFQVVEAQNLSADIGYACHKSAIHLVMQQGMRIQVQPLLANKKYGYVLAADVVFGVKQMSNLRSVKINEAS